ncbi:ABC transporter permease [Rhodococcus sp. NPDC060176]|uniref:ABC transporter permease n=1 Tax=Rhodococcus sp. NPDC060176 TaxID=3347062 RepID=UPI003653B92B
MLVISVLALALSLGWAIFPSLFTNYPADVGVPADRLQPPSTTHWFGTDYLGRDTFSRTVHAAGLSLTATALAVAIAVVIGTSLGVLAGFLGRAVDEVISRVTDVLLSIPSLLLSMAIITAMGFGTIIVAIAVGISAIASFTRVTRTEVMRIRHFDFIEAAHGSGISRFKILVRHALPNAFGPVAALSIVEFGGAVLAVAALSFLGFGAQPPTPEWGSMIAEGRDYIATAWWLITLPGLVVVAVVLSANRLAAEFDRGQA